MTGAELKAARLRLGLTQLELAERLHIPVNTIARWERGELKIEHAEVIRLAVAHLSCRPHRSH